MPDQTITLRYFAGARDLAGCAEETLPINAEGASQSEVRDAIARRHPPLAPVLVRVRLARNDAFMVEGERIEPGDKVDILPPVAGGSGDKHDPRVALAAIRSEPLSLDEVDAAIRHPGAGGIALFVGVVRNHADGRQVVRLDYEHHPVLAESELRAVLAEVAEEFADDDVRLAASHRVGQLSVGDKAVIVGASAPHRDAAFRACRAAIDTIKERVPIWKHEWEPSGESHWVRLGAG